MSDTAKWYPATAVLGWILGGRGDGVTAAIEERVITAGGLEWELGIAEDPAADAPTALLLHGFPEYWRCWEPQLEAFAAARFRAVAPNLPGYGRTSEPSDYRIQTIAARVADLAREVSPSGVHLVGHDWGGIIGHAVAHFHPEVVRSFAAVCAPHPAGLGGVLRDPTQLLRSWYVLAFQIPGVEWLLGKRDRISSITGGRAVTNIDSPDAMRRALAYYRHNLRPWRLSDATAGRITVPGIVVHAERDVAIGAALMEAAAEQFDDLRGYHVLDCGHFLQRACADKLNPLLLDLASAA